MIVHTYSHSTTILDVVVTNNEKNIMFCSSEKQLFAWDTNSRTELWRLKHPEKNFIYLLLSSDNKKLYSNAYGPYIYVIDAEKGPEAETSKFDIIKDSGWVLFELSPDGKIMI